MAERPLQELLAEQRRYYSARAGEYEDWWFRRGRYAHGNVPDTVWFAEVERVRAALARFAPRGRVLELACGTGLWTEQLVGYAQQLTALDASAEVLELAREKVPAANVEWLQADVFSWQAAERYDVCFFGFWLSHVPGELMEPFWQKVERSLAPGGRVFVIDSAVNDSASARDHQAPQRGERRETRRLADGREFRIVKHWFDAASLQRTIERLGWRASIEQSDFFVYGEALPGESGAEPAPGPSADATGV